MLLKLFIAAAAVLGTIPADVNSADEVMPGLNGVVLICKAEWMDG